jgi:hypothetical protein
MRLVGLSFSLVAALAFVQVGCGGDDSGAGTPDAASNPADSGATTDAAPGTDLDPPAHGFQIKSTDITIAAGEEVTYCYYTTIPLTAEAGVYKWESHMTPGSHHLILYATSTQWMPDGTMEKDCSGFSGGADIPAWTYASQNEDTSFTMPTGVGMTIAAGQHVFVQMHYLNTTDAPIVAHVTINGSTFPDGMQYTKAAAFVTYDSQISIPAMSTGSAERVCNVPAGAKFFLMSTHAHKHSTHTEVRDGSSMVFQSNDWEHPGAQQWTTDPFFSFASGKLTIHCDYQNDTGSTIVAGPSAQTNEMCMASGYFFPATGPKFCLNGTNIN